MNRFLAAILWLTCSTAAWSQSIVINGSGAADNFDVSGSSQSHTISSRGGFDTVRGSQAGDRIDGGGGNDQLYGNGGDDTLIGGLGSDLVDGGSGRDVAVFSGLFANYRLVEGSNAVTVTDLVGNDGKDTLTSIELMEFLDGSWDGVTFVPKDGSNRSPSAGADSASVAEDGAVLIEVLSNDSDPDGDSLVIETYSQAAHGAVTKPDASTLRYAPAPGFSGSDSFTYRVGDGRGGRATGTVTIDVVPRPTGDALRAVLANAPAGSWLRVNRNLFSDVWAPLAQRPGTGGANPARILFAWSSMAWDPNRDMLVFWGGGHANYSGNEVYRFDARTLLWERASLPSAIYNPLGDQQWFAVDGPYGAPIAAHTYDNQEFLPLSDRFVTFGGGKFNSDAYFVLLDGTTPTGPYFWDPSRADPNAVGGAPGTQVAPASFPDVFGGRMWENRDTLATRGVGPARPFKFVNGATAYAGADGKDVLLVAESPGAGSRLFRYTVHDLANPAADQWEVIGIKGDAYSDQGAGAYDPGRKLFARTAKGSAGQGIAFWNLATAGPTNRSRTVYPFDPTGEFALTRRHGMDFDAVRRVFVLWDGNADVWHLTPPRTSRPAPGPSHARPC